MNNKYRHTYINNASNQTHNGRWDRITKIIKDGISKDVDLNNQYYVKLLTALADHGAANTCVLTGIV